MKTKIIFLMLILILLVSCKSQPTNNNDALAQCLTQGGAVMYGTEWCGHCQNQKAMFGDSFQYINFVDCDKNRDQCLAAGVQGYPTWIINGQQYMGTQTLAALSSIIEC